MPKNERTRAVAGVALLASTLGTACSILNSYDDVVPLKVVVDASTGADVTTQTDAGIDAAVDAPIEAADEAAVDAGIDSPIDSPPDTYVYVNPDRGVVVIGGALEEDGGRQLVLTAIDPLTGTELPNAREPMNVSAVLYDGARDLWYIFESSGIDFYALPTDTTIIHVRSIDTIKGTWTEHAKIQAPPSVSYLTTGVITGSVVYTAYGTPTLDGGTSAPYQDGGTLFNEELVEIKTSDPAHPVIASEVPLNALFASLAAPVLPVGLLATPNTNGQGGTAILVTTQATHPFLVPFVYSDNAPEAQAAVSIAQQKVGSSLGAGIGVVNGSFADFAVTESNGSTTALIAKYDPLTAGNPFAFGRFTFGDTALKPTAFAPCSQTLFALGTNADLGLYAIDIHGLSGTPDDAGLYPLVNATSLSTGHSGQAVYYEPYTATVLAPFSQGPNYALTAFTLSDGPRLKQRVAPEWSPPANLRPNFVATRTTNTFCEEHDQ